MLQNLQKFAKFQKFQIDTLVDWQSGQTLEGSSSAVPTPTFALKTSFESSCLDLHNTHFSTDLRSQMFKYDLSNVLQHSEKITGKYIF